jgi:Iron-containing redox enzyme
MANFGIVIIDEFLYARDQRATVEIIGDVIAGGKHAHRVSLIGSEESRAFNACLYRLLCLKPHFLGAFGLMEEMEVQACLKLMDGMRLHYGIAPEHLRFFSVHYEADKDHRPEQDRGRWRGPECEDRRGSREVLSAGDRDRPASGSQIMGAARADQLRPPAGRNKAGAMRRARCSPTSTAGSPKASIPPT